MFQSCLLSYVFYFIALLQEDSERSFLFYLVPSSASVQAALVYSICRQLCPGSRTFCTIWEPIFEGGSVPVSNVYISFIIEP